MRWFAIVTPFVLTLVSFCVGCEKTVEEGAIKPLEVAFDSRQKASLEAARSAVGSVRLALLARQAQSPISGFPDITEIRDFASLKQALPEANLPEDMATAQWDPSAGISYLSDGNTFTFTVQATGGGISITATPNGITVGQLVP